MVESVDPVPHPAVEGAQVVLSRNQDAAGRVRPRAHPGLGALAGVEVLQVDPVEQLDRPPDLPTSEPDAITSGAYSQSHYTCVESTASGVIRSTITWSGTRFRNTVGLIVAA